MKRFEQLDFSGDVALRIWGKDLDSLFNNAADGMSSLITDISLIRETEEREIRVLADSREDLLINWLNELIFLFDTYRFVGTAFMARISKSNSHGYMLKALISGGIFDPNVHECRLLIKAATYHDLSIKKANGIWEATVIFDI